MKIKRTIEIEEEFTPRPYMKTPYDHFKTLSNGTVLRVSDGYISTNSRLSNFDIERMEDSTKEEFDAAYELAAQNIREAFLS